MGSCRMKSAVPTPQLVMKRKILSIILLAICFVHGEDKDTLVEDDEGVVEEDLSTYKKDGKVLYKVLYSPHDCDGPSQLGDDVEMNMEYFGANKLGDEVEMKHALTTKLGHGQVIRISQGEGIIGMCLGERRRLVIPQQILQNKYAKVLPGILEMVTTYLEVELTAINGMTWKKFDSGLLLALLEQVEPENCARTVTHGDTLAVEYEGKLESGKVFDSSKTRGAPFGPFRHGYRQIIDGYTEALEGRCLGERWRMTVPPHLAYGEDGVGDDIPGGATLIFDVRLVRMNSETWDTGKGVTDAYSWEELYRPEECDIEASFEDYLTIHYTATREDGSTFGTVDAGEPPYGPFSLSDQGTTVQALDQAIPGMCLGERRMVNVPPRMGWIGGHHDTIQVELFLVKINNWETEKLFPIPPPKQEL